MVLYYILAIFAVVLILFLTLPSHITLSLSENKSSKITLSFFGGLIKFSPKGKDSKKNKRRQKTNKDKSDDEQTNEDKSFIAKINELIDMVRLIRRVYSETRLFVRKRIYADVTIHISFDLYDAALTGIATGIIWTLLYELLGLISTVALIDKHDFNVEPLFNDKFSFGASGECSFKFSPGNAIVLLIYTLFKYRKIKKDIEKIRKAGK